MKSKGKDMSKWGIAVCFGMVMVSSFSSHADRGAEDQAGFKILLSPPFISKQIFLQFLA
jgi:hypothetical protein